MRKLQTTTFDHAQRYVGEVYELAEQGDHPLIQWWHSRCKNDAHEDTPGDLQVGDEVAWCSSFVNGIAWDLRLPRSKSKMARSWLGVGYPIRMTLKDGVWHSEAEVGYDVVVISRGDPKGPLGHVGFYAGMEGSDVLILGGNQGDAVSIAPFPASRVLGVRRLLVE